MPEGRKHVARLFDRVSRVYDVEALQRLVYRPAQEMALAELRECGARRVLDVGCGTGLFASRLFDELGADVVCGIDLSSGMLEQAKARSSDVEWVLGNSGRLPFGDRSFDAVVCTEAFHFFDQPAALAEFHRVLADGGLALVALINPRTELGSRLVGAQPGVLSTASWPTKRRMRGMVEDAGFDVRAQHRVNRIFGHVLPTVLTIGVRPA